MKVYLIIFSLLFLIGCSKPKTVLICGDHICVNKAEAEIYFEENLSLEVRLVNPKKKDNNDLIELNLNENNNGNKEITIKSKEKTSRKVKVLSNEQIEKKKIEVNRKKIVKKNELKNKNLQIRKKTKLKQTENKKIIKEKIVKINKLPKESNIQKIDICTILEKCSIDEISRFLINEGKNKKFPDITSRE